MTCERHAEGTATAFLIVQPRSFLTAGLYKP
jgi:hypothetical protein